MLSEATELLHIFASVAVLYVSYRLARFESQFMEKLEEKFVNKEVWDTERASTGRTLDRLWKKVFNGYSAHE